MSTRGKGRSVGSARTRARLAWAATVAVPLVAVLVGGWQRRWLCDDAFINFRVIHQFTTGHGPVFNQGERVEVTTSPLWAAMVGATSAVTRVRLEWIAVLGGLTTTGLAVVVGAHGARRLHTDAGSDPGADRSEDLEPPRSPTWWLPAGALAFACIPVVWDFATGGLENGLSWLWWAATFALAVRVTVGAPDHRSVPERDGVPTATEATGATEAPAWRRAGPAVFVAGLAPLVRPDLVVPGLAFFALVVIGEVRRCSGRRARLRTGLGLAGIAGAIPGLYQVFRMGYYGQLLPNTVYAKEGGRAWWSQGWEYLGDLVGAYWLWVPLVALVGLAATTVPRRDHRRSGWVALVATAEGAAVAHALLIVRAGGDYMQGRLLLPALFGMLLPVFVLPVPAGAVRRWALPALALGLWVVVCAALLRPEQTTFLAGRFDDRQYTIDVTGHPHPILVRDHVAYLEDRGLDLRSWGRGQPPGWSFGIGGPVVRPLRAGQPTTISTDALGAAPYRLPLDVYVEDRLGLADPVVAHVALRKRGIPGHEKHLRETWWAARLLPEGRHLPVALNNSQIIVVDRADPPSRDPAVVRREQDDADAALRCGTLAELVSMARAPLTPGRFLSNLVRAPGRHSFRFDADPAIARRELCR